MENKNLEYRMYFLVPYNISGRQSGIQALHGVVEYQLLYGDDIEYLTWARHWKTVMMMNGGTSNNAGSHMYENQINNPDGIPFYGTMEQHGDALTIANIKYSAFFEPDANNMLTSIAFLCDERVFKTRPKFPEDVYYPGFEEWLFKIKGIDTVNETLNVREQYKEEFKEWVNFVGGESNVFLRSFVSKFKLAEN